MAQGYYYQPTIDLSTADEILNIYHDEIARVRTHILEENAAFAMGIVEEFKTFVWDEYGLAIAEVVPVGSASEGLKVHKPDEFDFLLVMMALDEDYDRLLDDDSDHPIMDDIADMETDLGEDADVLKGLHPILLSRSDCKESPAFWNMREIWPDLDENFGCLSAEDARNNLYDYTAEFVGAWRARHIKLPGVKKMQAANKGNPAIKMVVHKSNWPVKINIDMSPCVRVDGVDDLQNDTSQYFIAKRKQALKAIPDAQYDSRYDLLWFQTDSPYENDTIAAREWYERRNLRIMKSLFKDDVYHTHIWKKIFMNEDLGDPFPKSPIEFIQQFMDVFVGWLQVELARRYQKGNDDCYVGQPIQYYEELVADYFNEYENILVRYEDKGIIKWYNKFQKLRSLLAQGNYGQFLWKTVGEEKWAELNIDMEFPPGVVSDSDSESESSDSDNHY